MPRQWNGESEMARIREEAAKRVLAAAVFFRNTHANLISGANPRPYNDSSKPGEYLKRRTGDGESSLTYWPETWQAVAQLGECRVGYVQNIATGLSQASGNYMLYWELFAPKKSQRKGLQDTLATTRQQISAYVVQGSFNG